MYIMINKTTMICIFYVCTITWILNQNSRVLKPYPDAFIFGGIPVCAWWRTSRGKGVYDDMDGQTMQTVKVPQRSVSKNSLAGDGEGEGAIEYGSTQTTNTKLNGEYGTQDQMDNYGGQNGYGPGGQANPNNPSPNPHNPFTKPAQGGFGAGDHWRNNKQQSNEPWKPPNYPNEHESIGLSGQQSQASNYGNSSADNTGLRHVSHQPYGTE